MKQDNATKSSKPSILIAGAGSIGTVMGMLLCRVGYSVEMLRRRNFSGDLEISVIGLENFSRKMKIYNTNFHIKRKIKADIIIITVQAQQTQIIMDFIIQNSELKQDTIIVNLQNGLTPASIISNSFQRKYNKHPILIQGAIWWSATLIDDVTVLYHTIASTVIGIPKNSLAQTIHLDQILHLLSSSFKVSKTSDIQSELRKKLLLNVVSPVLALLKQPYPTGINTPIVRKVVHAMFDEVVLIAIKEQWNIDDARLNNFHATLASDEKIIHSINYTIDKSTSKNIIHKVSTQISAEKHGGIASNARELLSYFISKGAISCQIILDEIERLPKNYQPISHKQLEIITSQFTVKTCKFVKTNDNYKFNYD